MRAALIGSTMSRSMSVARRSQSRASGPGIISTATTASTIRPRRLRAGLRRGTNAPGTSDAAGCADASAGAAPDGFEPFIVPVGSSKPAPFKTVSSSGAWSAGVALEDRQRAFHHLLHRPEPAKAFVTAGEQAFFRDDKLNPARF